MHFRRQKLCLASANNLAQGGDGITCNGIPFFCNPVRVSEHLADSYLLELVSDVNCANYPLKTRLHSMLCIISFAEMGISVRYGGRH